MLRIAYCVSALRIRGLAGIDRCCVLRIAYPHCVSEVWQVLRGVAYCVLRIAYCISEVWQILGGVAYCVLRIAYCVLEVWEGLRIAYSQGRGFSLILSYRIVYSVPDGQHHTHSFSVPSGIRAQASTRFSSPVHERKLLLLFYIHLSVQRSRQPPERPALTPVPGTLSWSRTAALPNLCMALRFRPVLGRTAERRHSGPRRAPEDLHMVQVGVYDAWLWVAVPETR